LKNLFKWIPVTSRHYFKY